MRAALHLNEAARHEAALRQAVPRRGLKVLRARDPQGHPHQVGAAASARGRRIAHRAGSKVYSSTRVDQAKADSVCLLAGRVALR